ncbi:MAG: hypothetical protein RMK74_12500 [Myxococcales bacterium]|nr:hypothetical protein [Myxococcales bacterium]
MRSVEAWLLADADGIASMLGLPCSRIPHDPERLDDPKRCLLELARMSSKQSIRDAMLPPDGGTSRIGPGYAACLIRFSAERWRPHVAARRSRSLDGLLEFLRKVRTGSRCRR